MTFRYFLTEFPAGKCVKKRGQFLHAQLLVKLCRRLKRVGGELRLKSAPLEIQPRHLVQNVFTQFHHQLGARIDRRLVRAPDKIAQVPGQRNVPIEKVLALNKRVGIGTRIPVVEFAIRPVEPDGKIRQQRPFSRPTPASF